MKKNRSSFFNETMDYYNTQMPNMIPNTTQYSMSQSGFYTGNMPMQNNMVYPDDLNSRIAKLERQVNRLDHRITALEQNNTSYSTDDKDTTINNMYMV